MNIEFKPNLGGVPERFKQEGVFAHNKELIKVGDTVESLVDSKTGIKKGGFAKIIEIIVEPSTNERGFYKRIKLEGFEGEFNPKKFKKITN
jgi:hypothetical protein